MFNILIDTCVWLELAKDYQQQAILSALEELIQHDDLALILPRTVVDERTRSIMTRAKRLNASPNPLNLFSPVNHS